ncbi:hypothetical protein QQ045_009941 [Rhodiola kirilowii]
MIGDEDEDPEGTVIDARPPLPVDIQIKIINEVLGPKRGTYVSGAGRAFQKPPLPRGRSARTAELNDKLQKTYDEMLEMKAAFEERIRILEELAVRGGSANVNASEVWTHSMIPLTIPKETGESRVVAAWLNWPLKLVMVGDTGCTLLKKNIIISRRLRVESEFLRTNRALTRAQRNFIVQCGSVRNGSTKAHRIMKEVSGGYENVGATVVDCKNFKRDLKLFIGDCDAQMIVDKLTPKKYT